MEILYTAARSQGFGASGEEPPGDSPSTGRRAEQPTSERVGDERAELAGRQGFET
jgi:hypothetical protein